MVYAPNYINDFTQPTTTRNIVLQNEKTFDTNLESETKILVQENIELKKKIQDLEGQILNLNQSKNTKTSKLANQNQEEENSYGLQAYENKSLEVYQQEEIPLKTKKGIFGTKFVEDKSSKK